MHFELSFNVISSPSAPGIVLHLEAFLPPNCTVLKYAYIKQPGVRLSRGLKQHQLSQAELTVLAYLSRFIFLTAMKLA